MGIQYLDGSPTGTTQPTSKIQYLDNGPPASISSNQPINAGLQNIADKISGAMKTLNMGSGYKGTLNTMQPQGDSLFNKMGENLAGYLGEKGVNPYIAAIPSTAISMANPENWIVPETGGIEAAPLAPNIPPTRQAGVAAAQQANIPLTRAEMSGSMPAARLESFLQKTPLGSKPIQAFRTQQQQAIDDLLNSSQAKFGTSESPTLSGMAARESLQGELGKNKEMSQNLYKQVPDVQIPTPQLQNEAQSIIQEQGKLPTSSQNPQIIGMASDYLNMGSPGYAGAPPSFQIMNKIRSDLGDIVRNGQGTDRMYAARLQSALNSDIDNFSSQPIVGPEFNQTFSRAQGFWKNSNQLQNNPLVQKLQTAPFQDMQNVVFGSGDPQKVLTAQAALGDAGYEPLKRQFFSGLIMDPNLSKKLANYSDDFLNTAFTPRERQALDSASQVKQLQLGAEKLSGNPSGTGQTVVAGGSYGGALEALRNFPHNPIGATLGAGTILGGPYLAAKAYLSPLMTRGIPISVNPTLTRNALTAALAGSGQSQ